MFIKLTKLDGSPIWINATFVVTVEPRRGGGAVVVPVGDGLDYDVRESPEKVLSILGDAPMPAVVPIPTSDALTKTPSDVSPERESNHQLVSEARQAAESDKKPEPPQKPILGVAGVSVGTAGTSETTETSVRTEPTRPTELTQSTELTQPAEPPQSTELTQPAEPTLSAEPAQSAEEKPTKKIRKTAAAKKPRATRKAKKPDLPISEEQVERLKKMAPGSVRKLQNTLQTQFKVEDADGAVKALEANGIIALDRDHVVWGLG